MAENVYTLTIKPIADLGDIKANVGTIQSYFDKLKMPKFSNQIKAEADKIEKAYDNINKKQIEGIKTASDANYIEKNQNIILHSWNEILEVIKEVNQTELDINFDKFTTQVKEAEQAVESLRKEIDNKLANSKVDLSKLTNSKTGALRGENALGKVTQSKAMRNFANQMDMALQKKQYAEFLAIYKAAQQYVDRNPMFGDKVKNNMSIIGKEAKNIENVIGNGLIDKLSQAEKRVNDVKADAVKEVGQQLKNCANNADEYGAQAEGAAAKQKKLTDGAVELNKTAQAIERQVESYFGLNAIFRTVANMAREAMQTVKELDKAMTETAVVTNFSVGDMWEKLPLYTAEANKLGSSIKDVYEATTLYYQQGLNTTQSMGLAVETLKMARIAGMDAKDATDAMTAALRGFNLEINQASAQRINDVYSELAAITASDTQEISTAMEKVASLAHNAGMEVETTSAFLAQMIETTREAPENLGTALKTVVARFQEMKEDPTKLIDSEGVMLDANKVDKALKSIGVNLMDTNGQFRKLDDVFLEIASRWDTLTMGQQRYIATMAAGSRQQSRFIAMMSDYTRTMELVDAAYDSSGASQRQFEKTLESMDAKLNKLKNAYDQFIMGLMNNEFLKGVVDLGTDLLTLINNVIDGLSNLTGPLKSTTKMILTLLSTFGGLTAARGLLKSGIGLGVQWFSGKEARKQFESKYLGKKEGEAQFRIVPKIDRQTYDAEKAKLIADTKKPILQHIEVDRALHNNKVRKDLTDDELRQGQKWNGFDANTQKFYTYVDKVPEKIIKTSTAVNNLGASFQNAGFAVQAFGNLLQNTPLAPFGKIVSIAGTAITSLGGVFGTVSALMVKESMTLGAALWATLAPIMAIGAAIAALAGIGYLFYQEFTKDKREMEALAEAANVASDAFDNLKTASEELKNSIQDIRDSESTFDNLVVGTTEWNQALIEANQQILDLIHKYEILRDYVTTDENGLMHISEEGFKAVQEQQAKWQEQAQALDILNNANYNAKLLEQEQNQIAIDQGLKKPGSGKTVKRRGKTYTLSTAESERENTYNQLDEESREDWDNIQAKIEADAAAARKQAVRAALATSGEMNDTMLSLFAQNMDGVIDSFKNETDMSVIKQAYTEFTGGVFDAATGTIKDISGEEVDVDDDTLKRMYPQIMALLKFQDQADEVNNAITSVSHAFEDLFGLETGKTFIDDLLNNNLDVNVETLEKFRNMSDEELKKALENVTEEQIHAIMQSDTANVTDLIALLRKNGDNLKQAQTNTYKNAAIWYAKLYNYSAKAAGNSSKILAKTMTEGLTSGSASALNSFMEQISTAFNYTTTISMGRNLFSSLLGQPEEVQEEISSLINGVDWTSAIERGQLYSQFYTQDGKTTDAYKELSKSARNFVKEQRKVDKSVDLTGQQFEELVQSSDFLEILTNKWKDFANETGRLDASGVEKMAEECGTLNDLLELGELDANTLATALNYFNETGSFEGITGAVLSAIDEFDSLDKLINQVKKDIDTFTPGENYEQGIEAFRGYANSLKENYENGKYSSADTLSYAQALTNINWKEYVKKHGKSNKSAEKELIDSLSPLFTENEKDTTLNILKRMEQGKTLTGKKAKQTDAFTIGRGEEGQLQLHIDEKTTREEFQQALQDAYDFSEEFARAFTLSLEGQDWGFIDDNITDGFNKAGRSEGISRFVQGIAERALLDVNKKGIAINQINGQQIGENNQLVISQSELEALRDLGGYENLKEVRQALADELGVSVEHIRSFNEETQNADNYLKKRFGKEGTQESRAENFLNDFKDSDGITNFDKATAELEKSGISASKALNMAVEMAKTAGEEEVKWGNKLVPLADIINGEQFNEAVDKLEDEAKWTTVGEKIGEAVANVLHEHGIGKESENKTNTNSISKGGVGYTPEYYKNYESTQNVEVIYHANNSQLVQATKEVDTEIDKTKNEIRQLEEQIENPTKFNMDDSEVALAQKKLSQLKADLRTLENKKINITARINVANKSILRGNGLTTDTEATGKNNYISPSGFYTGSMARGNGKGTLGPKGKGGLTLTGERGYEIAWLPSQDRSMILGAHGPQMVDLPADAVIWNHKQSKRIVAQKSIPLGSMPTGNFDDGSSSDSTTGTGKGKGKGTTPKSSDSKKEIKAIDYWYKTEIKRFNWVQKINDIVKDIENNSRKIDKTIDKIGTKREDIEKLIKQQNKEYEKGIKIQEKVKDSYNDELKKLNGTYKNKDGKKVSRALHFDYTNSSGDSKQKKIKTGDYITNKNGYYEVDQKAVEKYFKANPKTFGKEGSERYKENIKAFIDMLTGAINTAQSGYDNADKAIQEYTDKIEDNNQKLEDWEEKLPYENVERSLLERWNREQQLNKVVESIADEAEKVEKVLEDITSTWEEALKASKQQYKDIAEGQKISEKQRKSYETEGNNFIAGRRQIFAEYTNSNGTSKHVNIDPSQFMTGNAESGFQIDRDALKEWMKGLVDENGKKIDFGTGDWFKANLNSIAQTAMDEAGRISDGWSEANDSVKDYQKQQKDLDKQIAQAFVGWKSELTQIYILTSQIAHVEATTKTNQTKMKSLTNQIALGLISISDGLKSIGEIAEGYIDLLEKSKTLKVQELEAQKDEARKLRESKDERERYQEAQQYYKGLEASGADSTTLEKQQAIIDEAKQEWEIASKARELFTTTKDENGNTISVIDEEALESFKNDMTLQSDFKKAVEDHIKEIQNSEKGVVDLQNQVLDLDVQIQELEKQSDKTLADFEKELADALEAQVQKQIDSMEGLSESLDNAAQSILEQARRTLDARRQENQNAQTESDINKKEQRLAALRANTAGGNQVEIAQLEKEIAQDRQAYQESLEDQLLDKISQQNDDAKKQREIQIQIARQQLQYNKDQGKFMEEADKKIKRIEDKQVQDEIRKLLQGQGEGKLGEFGTKVQNEDFDAKMGSIVSSLATIAGIDKGRKNGTIEEGIPATEEKPITAEEQNKKISKIIDDKVNAAQADREAQTKLTEATNQYAEAMNSLIAAAEQQKQAADRLKNAEIEKEKANNQYESAKTKYIKALNGGTQKEIDKASAKLKEAESRKAAADKNYKNAESGLKTANKNYDTVRENKNSAEDQLKAAEAAKDATEAARKATLEAANKAWEENLATGNTHARGKLNKLPYEELKKGTGQITRLKEGLNDLIDDGLLTGVKKLNSEDTYGDASHAAVKALQAAIGAKQTGKWDEQTALKLKYDPKFKYYATGGLANYTGPAWLDGTPSKPELVLNAQDTKNFMALKDILSGVMRSISHTDNSNVTNAPTEFNININVDKIANDYDVKQLANTLKKEIVKSASYRNVTSIRNLR